MNKDLEKVLIDGLTDVERESVKAGNSCIKFVGIKSSDGRSVPSLATIYFVPGQGVYRLPQIKATLTILSAEGLQKFALGLLGVADEYLKKEDVNQQMSLFDKEGEESNEKENSSDDSSVSVAE